ncbi:uncharacterized protein [Asterias amurensis]|uniref:uncharacterized protein n=1 Tax=Asterias amurensis TaxID=7602 RepID=UPI003AB503E5
MASKVLLRRKKDDKKITKKLVGTIEQENLDKCPVFRVRYLGKTPAQGEYGREFIQEPVETLLKLKDRNPKLPKTVLQITERGFHFLGVNGTFGKEKHVLIPIHHVCYGVADEQNPHVFAIITRTDSNPENSLLECHAFLCDRQKVAAQITYWLLRTFLQVFEDLQRRRRVRQERKIRRLQDAALDPATNAARAAGYTDGNPGYTGADLNSPTDSIGPDIYSVTLEGSKDNGTVTAVGLTKTRPHSFIESGPRKDQMIPESLPASGGKKFATVPSRYSSQEQPTSRNGARVRQPVQQMHNSHESLVNRHPALKVSVSAGAIGLPRTESNPTKKVSVGSGPPVAPRWSRNSDTTTPHTQSFIDSGRGSKEYREDPRGKPPVPLPKKPPPPLHHQQQEIVQQQERNRYIKNANAGVSPVKTPHQGSWNGGGGRHGARSVSSSSRMSSSSGQNSANNSQTTAESDFVFIEMLQEEFSGLDVESSDTASTVRRANASYNPKNRSVSSGGSGGGAAAPPLDQKLSGEDIQKRIREWLRRTSPDVESVAFDDNILDRISLAGTLGHHDSRRGPTSPSYAPSVRSSAQSPIGRQQRNAAGTFNHMPSDGEYF